MPSEINKEMNKKINTFNLVAQYFDICNKALAQSKKNPFYAAIQTLINQFHSGEVIAVKVVDIPKQPGVPAGYYTTSYINGQFTAICESEHSPDTHFTLRTSFLNDVIEHADDYIKHPEKLDWSWLRKR
jgi:hypothetical protein